MNGNSISGGLFDAPCKKTSFNRNCQTFNLSGVKLHDPDVVQERLEQGIRTREDSVDTNCCVRARGLPWQASDQDIARFFVGLNVAK